MNKIDMAIMLTAYIYGAPISMIPKTHKEVKAYMRLAKSELKLKTKYLDTQPITTRDGQ